MTMMEFFLRQLESEAPRTRRVIERVPDGDDDWKPHDKSMPLGRLALLVATMPSWVDLVVNRDDLDLNPPGGSNLSMPPFRNAAERAQALDRSLESARQALSATSEEHLLRPWRLLVSGKTVSEDARRDVLRDTFMHWSHHRGQLTVYLRLRNAPVPSVYGPTADDPSFG